MDLPHGLKVDYKDGHIVASLPVAVPLTAELDKLAAKFESGEIDLIKGTDLDKVAMLQAISALKKEINK